MNINPLILAAGLLVPALVSTSCTPYTGLVARQENGIVTLTTALASVRDRYTADAAAPAVNRYSYILMNDIRAVCQKGRPTLLDLMMLKTGYDNSNIRTQGSRCIQEVVRIVRANFYGSTLLRNAFLDMLRSTAQQVL